ERLADTLPLPVGPHRQRPQGERRNRSDSPARAEHVPGDLAVRVEGDEREFGNPGRAAAQPPDKRRFRRDVLSRPGKRGTGDRAYDRGVIRSLTTYQHGAKAAPC